MRSFAVLPANSQDFSPMARTKSPPRSLKKKFCEFSSLPSGSGFTIAFRRARSNANPQSWAFPTIQSRATLERPLFG